MSNNNVTIGIIGLGYVGLPLAIAFGCKYKTIVPQYSIEKGLDKAAQ